MPSLNDLIAEYSAWNAANGLDLGSADEHTQDESLTDVQRDWLRGFVVRWDEAAELERIEKDRVVSSSDKIYIDDDGYGTETYLRMIHTTTLLALRRAVREANPGRIPIYSPYDCTGLVCCQTCKIIKIYKTSVGYSSVVEMCVTRDV